ncbi:MAG TPA: beta-propeller domain-containing protein [Acidimicrobiales bacterium]|nr:beta-propeller domain-containing protein [Acidimicrobiales bacterium]
MKRSKVQPAAAGLVAGLCLLGAGLATAGPAGAGGRSQPAVKAKAPTRPSGADLVAYTSCTQLLDQVKAEAMKEVGPYGLSGSSGAYTGYGPGGVVRGPVPLPTELGAASPAASPPSTAASGGANGGAGQPGYSTTNDQEAGVDEPDTVKTNGQVMVILRQQPLGVQVVDVSGSAPRLEGFLPLPQLEQASGLFLSGQDVYLIAGEPNGPLPVDYVGGAASVPAGVATPSTTARHTGPITSAPFISPPVLPWGGEESTEVVVISLADPEDPTIVRTFSFQGEEQGARLINGQVVLALTSEPRLRWAYPANGTPAAEKAATAANKSQIRSSTAADWLPSETVKTGAGRSARTVTRRASCARTYHTVIEAGLGTVALVSLDPASASPGRQVTVMGNAETVYASATDVYVATTNWQDQGAWGCGGAGVMCPMEPAFVVPPPLGLNAKTDIYGFDISDPSAPAYMGSGTVPGTLTGQYAMSEYGGYLRVATTQGEPTPAPADGGTAPPRLSDNMVSVLQPGNGALITVGTLHGLGRGEKIYAVRFSGALGYVVTFNQTDPLYVVDLSDPRHPAVAGQVSLAGYSSFLQPLQAGLLLGIGEAVDQQLRTEGLQLEVFNVADPGQPALVSRQQLGNGASSAAEYDPHAIVWWPASSLLVLPVDDYASPASNGSPNGPPNSSAGVWSISSSGTLHQLGWLTQPGTSQSGTSPDGYPEIERAVVVGGDIYTISEQGVMESDMSSLSRVAWLAYPATPS